MVVTEKILQCGLSRKGAYNRAQLEALLPSWEFTGPGTWSLAKGWKRRIIGADVPKEKIEQFLRLKDKHLRPEIKTGNLFEQQPKPREKRFWPDDFELEPGSLEAQHMQSITE